MKTHSKNHSSNDTLFSTETSCKSQGSSSRSIAGRVLAIFRIPTSKTTMANPSRVSAFWRRVRAAFNRRSNSTSSSTQSSFDPKSIESMAARSTSVPTLPPYLSHDNVNAPSALISAEFANFIKHIVQETMEQQLDAFRNEMRTEIRTVRTEMRTEVHSIRREIQSVRTEIARLEENFNTDVHSLRREIQSVRTEIQK